MRYNNRDDTFQVSQVTPDQLRPGDDLSLEPEFRVRVSPVANGWWTRAELTRLHGKIGQMLSQPAPVPPAGPAEDPER